MQIKKILYIVAKYLGDKKLIDAINNNQFEGEAKDLVKNYIEVLNVVQKRLATECFSLRTFESVEIKSQQPLFYRDLSRFFYKMIKVVSNDKLVKFDFVENGIMLPEGKCEIWYQYLPEDVNNIEEDVESFNGKVTERMYALGVCSEYCLVSGMYDTANYFEEKFIEAINSCRVDHSHKSMPKRRWL